MMPGMSVSVKRTLALEIAGQRAALDELHRDVGDLLVAAELVDGDDARVTEPPGGLRLVAKARGWRAGLPSSSSPARIVLSATVRWMSGSKPL
jgi:hypothetical protein